MSVIRTSPPLIGFDFTIYQLFRYLRESAEVTQLVRSGAPRNIGLALVRLGVAMLSLGLWKRVAFMLELRARRKTFIDEGSFRVMTSFLFWFAHRGDAATDARSGRDRRHGGARRAISLNTIWEEV
jgi:hypothetical protein